MTMCCEKVCLIDNTDGTVLDIYTDLQWAQDANLPGRKVSWQDANSFIEELNKNKHLGYNDWRLPEIIELRRLVTYAKQLFINVTDNHFCWLSAPDKEPDSVWIVEANNGDSGVVLKTDLHYVWPVRNLS